MVEKLEENQNVGEHSELIIVEIPYNCKLIMEISAGFDLLKLLAQGIDVEIPRYGEKLRITKKKEGFSVKFISRKELAQMQVESLLLPED